MTVGSGTPPATPLYNAMLTKVLLAIVMLFDSESRTHAHALVATNAATGPRGLVGSATGRRSQSWWTHSAVRAALEPASPGAKRYTTRDVLLIGASVTALLCVIVLIVLL